VILRLNGLFHKENILFEEEDYASSILILSIWSSWHKNIHVQNPSVSQERVAAELLGIVNAGSAG
jgi:hypothetical protein